MTLENTRAKLEKRSTANGLGKVYNRLKLPIDKPDIQKLIISIQRHSQILQFFLTAKDSETLSQVARKASETLDVSNRYVCSEKLLATNFKGYAIYSTNLSSTRCLFQLELASFLLKPLLARDRQMSSDRLQDIFGQHSRPDSRILALRICVLHTVSPEVLRLRRSSFRLSHSCRSNTIKYTGCQRSPFQFWVLPGLLIVECTGFLKHNQKLFRRSKRFQRA